MWVLRINSVEINFNHWILKIKLFPGSWIQSREADRVGQKCWSWEMIQFSNKILLTLLQFLDRSTGLLDSGMLVNIQQPLIRDDGTVLLATDSKVGS